MNGPPLTEIVATPERKTHIEVCVRIRPLVVGQESSTSFLRAHLPPQQQRQQQQQQRLRGSNLPRSSKLASPRRSTTASSSSNRRSAPNTPTNNNNNNNNVDESQETYAWTVGKDSDTAWSTTGRSTSYTLDQVYGPTQTTQNLYDQSVLGLVHAAMDGYHASVLAYGQTSTGKTHTMTGTTEQPGLIPLAIQECFAYLQRPTTPREYLLRLSYMEVYKEHIRDLLVPAAQQVPIRLFDTAADGLVIKGLREEVVTCPQDVLRLLAEGESRRQVGATTMNAHSSRSHVIVRLWIESRALPETTGGNMSASQQQQQRNNPKSTSSASSSLASSSRLGGNVRVSSLSLVDLAGSESVRLTGSNERRQEGHYINQSLMTLGKVVYALAEMEDKSASGTPRSRSSSSSQNNNKHIPYRDSKLTRLLQPSLSGNAQVVLVCCISPLEKHLEESHNTFKFAVRAKKIPQKATIQEEAPDERSLLQSYRDEIEALKKQLQEAEQVKQTLLAPAPPTNPAAQLLAAASFSSDTPPALTEDVVSEDEIQELVMSIQTMEKLILKSKPLSSPQSTSTAPVAATTPIYHKSPEEMLDDWDQAADDTDDDEQDLLALATSSHKTQSSGTSLQTPVRAPTALHISTSPQDDPDSDDARNLEIELSRIQGLLGSVLKKRQLNKSSVSSSGWSTASNNNNNNQDELVQLRAQLEQHQAASTIRKADSSFLQKQLEEKEDLLLEISKLLEQMEQRQVTLEKDNAHLKRQLNAYQELYGALPTLAGGGSTSSSSSFLRASGLN